MGKLCYNCKDEIEGGHYEYVDAGGDVLEWFCSLDCLTEHRNSAEIPDR